MLSLGGSSEALIEQSEKKLAQTGADYRRQLQAERIEINLGTRAVLEYLLSQGSDPRKRSPSLICNGGKRCPVVLRFLREIA